MCSHLARDPVVRSQVDPPDDGREDAGRPLLTRQAHLSPPGTHVHHNRLRECVLNHSSKLRGNRVGKSSRSRQDGIGGGRRRQGQTRGRETGALDGTRSCGRRCICVRCGALILRTVDSCYAPLREPLSPSLPSRRTHVFVPG